MVLRSNSYVDKEKLLKTRNKQRKRYYKKTQGNKPRKWTDEESSIILTSEMTDTELAGLFARSVQSIQCKRHLLKTKI